MNIRPFEKKHVADAVPLYCACFAEPPWSEVFDPADVAAEMNDVLSWPDSVARTVFEENSLMGAAYGFRLSRKPDVDALVLLPAPAFYVSEIFVAPPFRARGAARAMTQALLMQAAAAGYTHGAVRTSVDQPAIRRLFAGLGWIVSAEQTVLSQKTVDGQTVEAPDTRIIMTGRF